MPKPNQTKGAAANSESDRATAARDLERLSKMQKLRPLFPPHRHVFVQGGCRICGELEVEQPT